MYHYWYTPSMDDKCPVKRITVRFFNSASDNEPVKDWLLSLDREDRRTVGFDIKTVELGWPIGMPLVRKLKKDIWEVRCDISSGRIARVLFTVIGNSMVLLHGFIKKSQKTPKSDIDVADDRRKLASKKVK